MREKKVQRGDSYQLDSRSQPLQDPVRFLCLLLQTHKISIIRYSIISGPAPQCCMFLWFAHSSPQVGGPQKVGEGLKSA